MKHKYYSGYAKDPFLGVWNIVKNPDRVTPMFWIVIASVLLFFIGVNFQFLSVLVWVGGFTFLFLVALAVALFNSL